MGWIVDLVILLLLALCMFVGYKRGLTKCVVKVLSFVIALVIAIVLFNPVSELIIKNTEFDDNIRNSITSIIQKDVNDEGKVNDDSSLPDSMVSYINNQIQTGVEQTKESVVTSVAENVSVIIVKAVVAIGLFIGVRLLLLILTAVFDLLTELPVLKQIDKTGGIIYGILEAAVIVFVVFAIISFISPMIKGSDLINTIDKSLVGRILYNYNPIVKLIF